MDPELAAQLMRVDSKTLGARLKAARLAARLTQPRLAGESVSVGYISKIESGERRPSVTLLDDMCARLRISPEQIVLGHTRPDSRADELACDLADLSLRGGQPADALQHIEAVLASNATVALDLLRRARLIEGTALAALGKDRDAVAVLSELLTSSVPLPTRLAAAVAVSRLEREAGNTAAAIAVAERAVEEDGASNLPASEAGVRLAVTLAAALYEAGQTERAAALCRNAISAAETLEAPGAKAAAYWNASIIESEAGHIATALALARRALLFFEGHDDLRNLALLRVQLASIMLRDNQTPLEEAMDLLGQASREFAWSDATPGDRVRGQLMLARAHMLQGDDTMAYDTARAAVDSIGVTLPYVATLGEQLLGEIAWRRADTATAQRHYRVAVAHLTGAGADREAGQLWFDLGNAMAAAGMTAEAGDAFQRAASSAGFATRPAISGQPKASEFVPSNKSSAEAHASE